MKTYLVGGAVRDQLLQFPYTEKDWVVVGSSPEKMIELGYSPVGKDFPVFLHPKTHEEYALARTERKTAPGYKGFTFHTDKHVSLEDDLERRDLTINAIAQDSEGKLIDPYEGQKDIKNKHLRHVSPAFSEDPVRVLRVARFSARYHHLGFTVAKETLMLMQDMSKNGETQHLVPERVWQECQKALSEKHPEIFFQVLMESHTLHDIFPALEDKKIAPCSELLKSSCLLTDSSLIRFTIFCFSLEADTIMALCEHLNVPNEYQELATLTKKHYEYCTDAKQWDEEGLATLFQKTDALRKTERFYSILESIKYIYQCQYNDKPFLQEDWLLQALNTYKDVDHQSLIKQGYQKSALGKAIQEKRVELLKDWLKTKI